VRGSGGAERERGSKEGGLEFALFHRVFFCSGDDVCLM
jgi:hypothetical protein